ncbi:stealth conserved region 3 domain-containing protein [Paeniglutamicibacter sp. Y32M11]|uniref:stealth conserved region 3 domain-containing protein n=1 Tax=Paeniglutamicibacter sp. Y32M11 TaxID=2853258 RepID=UPI001C52FAD9|nr:stealth conserved region 3 domain-containing protein [Paeniglutamicibacter sp. Y32M11]QXQ08973.1 stealth family protein [Paeniglutamicibacter sp. Y32M11]
MNKAKQVRRQVQSIVKSQKESQQKRRNITKFRQHNLRSDLLILPAGGKSMVFRITEHLNLSQIKRETLEKFENLLHQQSIEYWQFEKKFDEPSTLHLSELDREKLLHLIRTRPEFNHWYFQAIGINGKIQSEPSLVTNLSNRWKMSGMKVYERVAFDSESSFRAGSSQGIEFNFWQHGEKFAEEPIEGAEGQKVVSVPIWNPVATTLPDFRHDQLSFEAALRNAQSKSSTTIDFEVDAVFTWVDGSDSQWQMKKAEALHILDEDQFVGNAVSDARFADHDELRYSLRSIEQFAPWIRKIWIVTAGQKPEWLDTSNPRIEIVDHSTIWPDEIGLPNFNSHAIESNLHRIPDLAEHFLYLNDDFILSRTVSPETFFYGNGMSKVFFSKALVEFDEVSELDNASTVAAKNARTALLSRGYTSFSRKFFHTPNPLRKSVIEAAEREFSEEFRTTRAAQFREATDIAVAGSFYFNYALATGNAIPGEIRYDYIDPATRDGRSRFAKLIRRRDKDCIVINDGSTPESDEQRIETDAFIRGALQRLLPAKSTFEL